MIEFDIDICPFCGKEAELMEETECHGHGDYHSVAYVKCPNCGAVGPKAYDYDYAKNNIRRTVAIDSWNERWTPPVLYLCNRERCEDGCQNPDCMHTTDIRHAKNFEERYGYQYWEKEADK